jgi:perosamine synthetase
VSPPDRIQIARPATGEEEWQAARAPLEDGWLTQGPRVAEFERAFAARHGTAHAVAASSGTTALHLALAALGVGPGDEVVVPSFTWVATANAVVSCGARPVLCDVDPRTYNIDPARLAETIGPKTRAIVPVHLFGLPADLDAVAAAARGLPLVEDAACAAGAAWRGRPVGSIGAAGVFSFHPRKTITTGEGGMVTTNDAALAERAARLRNHGAPDFAEVGFNSRLTDVQAAIGLVQLRKLDAFVDERAAIVATYRRELAGVAWLTTPGETPHARHGWQAFVCMVEPPVSRDDVIRALAARGIETRPGTHAIHLLPAHRGDDLPGARACHERSIALPLHNRLTEGDVARVIEAVREAS